MYKVSIKYFFTLSLLSGVVLRFYNLNTDSLWYDETFTFWISNPDFSFKDLVRNNILGEGSLYIYNFIIYFLNILFDHSPIQLRVYSAIFGTLSILMFYFISKNFFKSEHLSLISTSLYCLNIFLIKFSQEARVYSLWLLICLFSIFCFIKIIEKQKKNKNYFKYIFLFFIFEILAFSLHPFSIIIGASAVFFSFLAIVKNKKYLLFFTIISLHFLIILILKKLLIFDESMILKYSSWIPNINIKFFTNFYFSRFFGSRLLGLIHLFTLIFLIILHFKKKNIELDKMAFFLIIIFFTYFIPILYEKLFYPILVDRYIIFVIPVIILALIYLIFQINNNKLKIFLIFIFLFINFFNHFFESTFKQFYKGKFLFKPDFKSVIKYINSTDTKNFTFITDDRIILLNEPLNYYVNYLSKKNNLSLRNIDLKEFKNNKKENYSWFICIKQPPQDCNKVIYDNKLKYSEEIKFFMIDLIKLQKY